MRLKYDAKNLSKRIMALMAERSWERAEDLVVNSGGLIKYGAAATWIYATRLPEPRSVVNLATTFKITTDEFLIGFEVPMRIQAELNVIKEATR